MRQAKTDRPAEAVEDCLGQVSKGAAAIARDISARHYDGTWIDLAEKFGQSITPWVPAENGGTSAENSSAE